MNEPADIQRAQDPAKARDVPLAEFTALRAEIVSRITLQAALVGIGLTALGVILGLVVKKDGDQRLLMAIPPLALVVNLLYSAETYRMSELGTYVRTRLWPYLRDSADPSLDSWEGYLADRRKSLWRLPLIALVDIPAMGLFCTSSVAAMILVDDVSNTLRWVGWVLAVVSVLAPAFLGARVIIAAREPECPVRRAPLPR